jgi:hypothetical protein
MINIMLGLLSFWYGSIQIVTSSMPYFVQAKAIMGDEQRVETAKSNSALRTETPVNRKASRDI